MIKRATLALAFILLIVTLANAQTTGSPCLAAPSTNTDAVVPVLGVGSLVVCVPAEAAVAQAQVYKAYIDARSAQTLTMLCGFVGKTLDGKAMSECATPLTPLNLTAQHTVSISASVVAADGTREGTAVLLPFALRKVADPVNPLGGLAVIRPGGQQ